MPKRYFWLRLKDDFFDSKRIKKLRRMAGGDTYTIIYLKMQLKALKTDGILRWTGLEDNVADELALDLNENPDDVKVTLQYLLACGLAETEDSISFFFPYAIENTGSETAAAQRMREHRARNNVTPMLHDRYGEKEIDKEKEVEIESSAKAPRPRFQKPTLEEVKAYCAERKNTVDPVRFLDYYEANGWRVGKNPMKDWKAAVRTWESRDGAPKTGKNAPAACKDYGPISEADYDFGEV